MPVSEQSAIPPRHIFIEIRKRISTLCPTGIKLSYFGYLGWELLLDLLFKGFLQSLHSFCIRSVLRNVLVVKKTFVSHRPFMVINIFGCHQCTAQNAKNQQLAWGKNC